MNIQTQQVLLHFLERYESLLNTNVQDEIHPFFDGFFLKEELIAIIRFTFEANETALQDLETKTPSQLLALISDDVYILIYYLEQLKVTLFKDVVITNEIVWKMLEQLSQHTHYLASKDVAMWDEYDHANYRAMSHKAGRIKRVYGLYDNTISQEDAERVTSLPKRFYDTEEQAKQALSESKFSEEDTHILHLLIANP